jgi:hypothetical protein
LLGGSTVLDFEYFVYFAVKNKTFQPQKDSKTAKTLFSLVFPVFYRGYDSMAGRGRILSKIDTAVSRRFPVSGHSGA